METCQLVHCTEVLYPGERCVLYKVIYDFPQLPQYLAETQILFFQVSNNPREADRGE